MSGRPRDPGVDDAILRATMELAEENGYRAVSMEAVAARAGVSKQTVYRRYRSKGEVILDALAAYAAGQLPAPDTGTLRGDLTELLTSTFEAQQGISGILNRALAAEAIGDDVFARTVWDRLVQPRRDVVRSLLTRAREHGGPDGVPPGSPDGPGTPGPSCTPDGPGSPDETEFLVDLVYGPMWYRLLFARSTLDAAYARRLAEVVTTLTAGL